jgi:hypothetical protein
MSSKEECENKECQFYGTGTCISGIPEGNGECHPIYSESMKDKDIIPISASCSYAWHKENINKKRDIKHMLCNELARYIEEHFDELPVNYKTSDDINYSAHEEIHKVTINLANNLVPITLKLPNGQVTAYVSKEVASQFNNTEIDQITLKKKLTYGDLYNKFITRYPVDVYDWRPAGTYAIILYFKGDKEPIKIYYSVAKDKFYKCVKCNLHTDEEKKYEIKAIEDIWRDYNE